jgi:HK97 family phage portal protein
VLDPARVECEWDVNRPGYRRYRIDGGPWITSQEVFHVMGPSLPGEPVGLSVIRHAREAIGLGLTLEEFGARYFAQGSMAKVVIKVPNKQLGTEQAREIVNQYERFHRGPGNWHRPAILSGGGEIQSISIPPEDAQFLESREFQALDITRWFRVPPHRVSIMTKQSSWGSGLAEENTAMVQHTFRPWIMRFEAAFTAYAPGGEDSGMRIRLNDASLLRGTFKEQVDAWSKAVVGLIATPNEARKALGLDPIEGGDELQKPPEPAADPNAAGDKPPEGSKPNENPTD